MISQQDKNDINNKSSIGNKILSILFSNMSIIGVAESIIKEKNKSKIEILKIKKKHNLIRLNIYIALFVLFIGYGTIGGFISEGSFSGNFFHGLGLFVSFFILGAIVEKNVILAKIKKESENIEKKY